MKPTLVRAAIASILALGLAGSTAAAAPSTTTAERLRGPSGAASLVKIKMKDGGRRRFAPASVTVPRGTKVRWVNVGNLTHTTTADGGAWDQRLDPGDAFARRFRRVGTFAFHCSIHPEMTGTVTVT